jgi:hypothetical protein
VFTDDFRESDLSGIGPKSGKTLIRECVDLRFSIADAGICRKSCSRHIMLCGGGGMAIHFDKYEKQARQLEQIAKTLSKKSAKYAALKRTAWALAFVTMRHHGEFQTRLPEKYPSPVDA